MSLGTICDLLKKELTRRGYIQRNQTAGFKHPDGRAVFHYGPQVYCLAFCKRVAVLSDKAAAQSGDALRQAVIEFINRGEAAAAKLDNEAKVEEQAARQLFKDRADRIEFLTTVFQVDANGCLIGAVPKGLVAPTELYADDIIFNYVRSKNPPAGWPTWEGLKAVLPEAMKAFTAYRDESFRRRVEFTGVIAAFRATADRSKGS